MTKIGLIGVGRLGLMFALTFEKHGFDVVASSYKKDYVEQLQNRTIHSTEPGVQELLKSAQNIRFTTDNHDVIDSCDVIYVMVATPSLETGDYDVNAVWDVARDFVQHKSNVAGKLLVIGCTTNPGDCQQLTEYLYPHGVNVAYHPTMAAQGSVLKNIEHPPSLLFGVTDQMIGQKCIEIFGKIAAPDTSFHVMSPTAAEIVKLAGNCKATAIISFYNTLGKIIIESGLENDLDEAMKYTNTLKRDDFKTFGYGYGGPCFPRDNRSFVHYARKIGLDYELGDVVDRSNREHSEYLTSHFIKRNPANIPYYFDYVSYKPGVNIFEESQQLFVCKKLLAQGYRVYINPSKYLLDEIKHELQEEFGDLVGFESLDDLIKKNINVIEANIQLWI